MKCTSELESISSFRLNLITKQQQLYEFVIISNYTDQNVIIFEPVDIKNETQTLNNISNNRFEHILKFGKEHQNKSTVNIILYYFIQKLIMKKLTILKL